MRFKVANKRDSLMSRFRLAVAHPIGRLLLVAAVLSGAVLIVAGVRAYNRAGADSAHVPALSAAAASRSLTTQKVLPSERIEVELITVTPDGFQPKAITRASGKFIVALENRSGLKESSLRLDREAANRLISAPLISAPMANGRLNLKYQTDLLPGSYVLTEASHPDWVCRLTIVAK